MPGFMLVSMTFSLADPDVNDQDVDSRIRVIDDPNHGLIVRGATGHQAKGQQERQQGQALAASTIMMMSTYVARQTEDRVSYRRPDRR